MGYKGDSRVTIYRSYLSDKENVVSSARNVAVFDTIAALLAAFVIIPGMAAGGAELSSGGPGLMFIYLVNVFNGMPGGKIVGIVFYVCVLFAGMSSLVNLYEAPVATIQEKLKLNRVASVGIIAVAGCVVSLVIQGIVSGWMDAVSISAHLAQCSQQLCSSGLQERSLLLMLLMQVQISLLESGLYHLANMSLFHFHLLHLLQVLYLVELADGGLDWLIATGGLELADCVAIRLFCVVEREIAVDWTLKWRGGRRKYKRSEKWRWIGL